MKTMNNANRERFAKAADLVMSYVNAGMTPKVAVIKVAGDRQFTPDLVRRLCECWNLGRTFHQFRDYEALEDKLASVPILNTDEVAKEMFSSDASSAKAMQKAASFYERRPRDFISPDLSGLPVQQMTKVASSGEETTGSTGVNNCLERGSTGQTVNAPKQFTALVKMTKQAEELHGRALRLTLEINDKLDAVAKAIKRAGTAFDEIEIRAIAGFGARSRPFLGVLASRCGAVKRASVDGTLKDKVFFTDLAQSPYAEIGEAVEVACQIKKAVDEKAKLTKETHEFASELLSEVDNNTEGWIRSWMKTSSFFREGSKEAAKQEPAKGISLGKRFEPIQKSTTKLWKGMTERIQAAQGLGALGKEIRERDLAMTDVTDVFSPEHENELQRIRATAMLNQLMTSDPILKVAPPETVVELFNRVRDLRPDLLSHPELLRGLLRTLVEQQDILEPAFTAQLIGSPEPAAPSRT